MTEKYWWELTEEERRAAIIAAGQDPDLPPRGVASGTPPPGLRNWVCAADGHEDPDNSGACIHCSTCLELDCDLDGCPTHRGTPNAAQRTAADD